jgi:hypothetical protein
MRTIAGAALIVSAVIGWILMKNRYGTAGFKGNLLCIGLTVGGYFLIWG